jgi:hypothetical protein
MFLGEKKRGTVTQRSRKKRRGTQDPGTYSVPGATSDLVEEEKKCKSEKVKDMTRDPSTTRPDAPECGA